MDGSHRPNAGLVGWENNGRRGRPVVPAPTPRWRTGRRWVGLQLAAAVLLFLPGVGYAWFGPNRQPDKRPIAVVAPESTEGMPDDAAVPVDGETMLDLTLGDFEPFRAEGGVAVAEYPPGGSSSEMAGVMSPEVLYTKTGPMEVTVEAAPNPVQRFDPGDVVRSEPDAMLRVGQQAMLATGTALMLPAGTVIDLRNAGAAPTRLIDRLRASESKSTEQGGARWTRGWGRQFPYAAPPMSLVLRRTMLAPGASLPAGNGPAPLDLARQADLDPQDDGSVRNAGSESIDLYVLTVAGAADEPAQAAGSFEPLRQFVGNVGAFRFVQP